MLHTLSVGKCRTYVNKLYPINMSPPPPSCVFFFSPSHSWPSICAMVRTFCHGKFTASNAPAIYFDRRVKNARVTQPVDKKKKKEFHRRVFQNFSIDHPVVSHNLQMFLRAYPCEMINSKDFVKKSTKYALDAHTMWSINARIINEKSINLRNGRKRLQRWR